MKIKNAISHVLEFVSYPEYCTLSNIANKEVISKGIDDQEIDRLIDLLVTSLSVETVVTHSNFVCSLENSVFVLDDKSCFVGWGDKFDTYKEKFTILYCLFIKEIKKCFIQFTYENASELFELYKPLQDIHDNLIYMNNESILKGFIDKDVLIVHLVDNVHLFLKYVNRFNKRILDTYKKQGKMISTDEIYTPYFARNKYERVYWYSYMCNELIVDKDDHTKSLKFLINCGFARKWETSRICKDKDIDGNNSKYAEYRVIHCADKYDKDLIYISKLSNCNDNCYSYSYVCFPLKNFYMKTSLFIGSNFDVFHEKHPISLYTVYNSIDSYFPVFMGLVDSEGKKATYSF